MDLEGTAFAYSHQMARALSVNDGVVELEFDPDPARWPWLALPAQHPIVFEKFQYFGMTAASWALGLSDPNSFGALTRTEFELPPLDGNSNDNDGSHDSDHDSGKGHATHGTARWDTGDGGRLSFALELRNRHGQVLARSRGWGHGFQDRDFRAFRAAARQKVLDRHAPGTAFVAAMATDVGLPSGGVPFVSALRNDIDPPTCDALVTSDNGFHPGNPVHTGSGDHVNVAHMFDCALQLCHQLLRPTGALQCRSGRCAFTRFIELDVPFELAVIEHASPAGELHTLTLQLRQVERDCASISLELEDPGAGAG